MKPSVSPARWRSFRRRGNWIWAIALLSLLTACHSRPALPEPSVSQTIQLSSRAFQPNAAIPMKYACNGNDISPPLQWTNLPEGTRSLTLILDDPDAPGGTFVHWVLYDLPPEPPELPEAVPAQPLLVTGGTQGKNDFDRYGYGGPCPPSGTHRYVFHLYALDTVLDLPPGATKAEVLTAMQGHLLAGGELVGSYQQ